MPVGSFAVDDLGAPEVAGLKVLPLCGRALSVQGCQECQLVFMLRS